MDNLAASNQIQSQIIEDFQAITPQQNDKRFSMFSKMEETKFSSNSASKISSSILDSSPMWDQKSLSPLKVMPKIFVSRTSQEAIQQSLKERLSEKKELGVFDRRCSNFLR